MSKITSYKGLILNTIRDNNNKTIVWNNINTIAKTLESHNINYDVFLETNNPVIAFKVDNERIEIDSKTDVLENDDFVFDDILTKNQSEKFSEMKKTGLYNKLSNSSILQNETERLKRLKANALNLNDILNTMETRKETQEQIDNNKKTKLINGLDREITTNKTTTLKRKL